jgi:hypothetical protein
MGVPTQPLTLTPEQIENLNRQLSDMRHSVNNHLSLIVAAVELLRIKPEMRERMAASLAEQPAKITGDIARFSAEFERTLGIIRENRLS